ncbi:MAG: hypothetical protein ACRDY7_08695, partial [Acidimicrobiia bacterium]
PPPAGPGPIAAAKDGPPPGPPPTGSATATLTDAGGGVDAAVLLGVSGFAAALGFCLWSMWRFRPSQV